MNFFKVRIVLIAFAAASASSAAVFAQDAGKPAADSAAAGAEQAKAHELEKKFAQTEAERAEEERAKRRDFFLESEKRRQAELEKRLEAERKSVRQKYKKSIFSGLKGSAPELVADSPIDYDVQTGRVVAKDNAKLSDANFEISAGQIEFNAKSGQAAARGDVVITQENFRVLASDIKIDTRKNELSSARTRLGSYPLFAEAQSVETTSAGGAKDKKIKASGAVFYVGEPAFLSLNVKGDEFSYDPEAEFAELRNAYLRLGSVPFMYVPYYKQQGLDTPPIIYQTRVGYNGDYGFKWQNTVLYSGFGFIAPGALLDGYTKRGVLIGPAANLNYKGGYFTSKGEFISGYIRDQASAGVLNSGLPAGQTLSRDRYFIDLKNITRAGDNISLTTVLNYWSDRYVMRDFRESIFDSDQEPDNFAELVYTGESFNASVFTRFLPNSWETSVQRLPEARFDVAPRLYEPLGVYYNLYASLGYYREKSADPVFDTRDNTRFDAYFGLSRPIHLSSWATFTPLAGVRLTHYANTLDSGGNYWRALGQVGFDAQMQAWGLWQIRSKTLGLDGLRHSLRPILQYRYIPNAEDGKPRIDPLDRYYFDTMPDVLDLGLRRDVDDMYKTNVLRVGLENVFETRSQRYGSREVARLNLYQDFNFERRPYISDHSKKYSFSDFYFFGSVSPAEWLTIANYTRVNVNNGDFAETNSYIELHDGDFWRVAFGDIYLLGELNQYYVRAELRLTENYRLRGRWRYDYKESRMVEQTYSLWTRVGNSWAVEYRVSFKEGSKRENSLSVGANVRFLSY